MCCHCEPRRWMDVNGQHHAPASLPPGRDLSAHCVVVSLGGSQSRSGRLGEEKNGFPLPEFEPQIDLSLALLLACVIPELKEK